MSSIPAIFGYCVLYLGVVAVVMAGAQKFQGYNTAKKMGYFSCVFIFLILTLFSFFYIFLGFIRNMKQL